MTAAARRAARGYPWLLPALAVIGVVLLYPIVKVIQYSFTDRTTFLDGSFVGLDNYRDLFGDELFWSAFKNNLILLLSVPLSIAIALAITGVLYRGLRGSRVYELAIFLPFLPAVASIAVIFLYVLSSDGPLNELLRGAGADVLAQAWLTDPGIAIWSVLGVVLWKRIGFTVLLFTARMASIDRTLFDAAAVDGASWARTYWQVAVPQMRSIIQFAAVLGFIEAFSWTFAYIVILTRGGPDRSTFTLEYLLYRFQFDEQLVGLASAVAVVLLLAALAVAAYRIRTARREVFGERARRPPLASDRAADIRAQLPARCRADLPAAALHHGRRFVRARRGLRRRGPAAQPAPDLRQLRRGLERPRLRPDVPQQHAAEPLVGADRHPAGGGSAYGFTRFRFAGRAVLLAATIGMMAIPAIVVVVPLFILMSDLGLVNERSSAILAETGLLLPFAVFLLYSFMRDLPAELFEAADVDGASRWRQFAEIALPLSRPALATTFVVSAIYAWNDLLIPLVLWQTEQLTTLMVGLALLGPSRAGTQSVPLLMAGVTISVLPLLVAVAIARRGLVRGLAEGGDR